MTALWIAAAVLTLATLALVLRPLFRARTLQARLGYDIAVFQDQLREVDRDVETGLLNDEQAEAARTEIRRRMLAAAAHDQAEAGGTKPAGTRPVVLAAAVAVALPAGALSYYRLIGSPNLADQPYAQVQESRMGLNHEGAENIKGMVARLAERLKTNPDDADGWAMLGKSYRALGQLDMAAEALRKAASLGGGNAEVYGTLGEIVVGQGGGMVMPEAREAFLNALKADPSDPRARFYLGLARMQIGDARGAVAVWRDLEKDSPADASWMKVLREHIQEVAAEGGFDAAAIAPRSELQLAGSASPAPGTPAMAQAPHPGAGGQGGEEFVRQRVAELADRLAKNPDDADGWIMLGRSYKAMGEAAKSRDAYGRAAKLRPTDVPLQMTYAEALLNGSQDDKLPAEFVEVMHRVLKAAPNNADALYYVGLAEADAGRKDQARQYWTKLLGTLDPKSREYGELKGEIDKLGK